MPGDFSRWHGTQTQAVTTCGTRELAQYVPASPSQLKMINLQEYPLVDKLTHELNLEWGV